jgi:hypothetical protein
LPDSKAALKVCSGIFIAFSVDIIRPFARQGSASSLPSAVMKRSVSQPSLPQGTFSFVLSFNKNTTTIITFSFLVLFSFTIHKLK